jgi:hypothetical protein
MRFVVSPYYFRAVSGKRFHANLDGLALEVDDGHAARREID